MQEGSKEEKRILTELVLMKLKTDRETSIKALKEIDKERFVGKEEEKLLKLWEEADLLSLHIMTLFDTLPNIKGQLDVITFLIGIVEGITVGSVVKGVERCLDHYKTFDLNAYGVGVGGGDDIVH